jgi:hypothetical protein
VAIEVEPTSLNGGEGLVTGWTGEVQGVQGEGEGSGRKEVVVEENERTSTHDGVDVCLKLRSSAKITFDMNACQPDNKIKSCISL